MSVRLFAVWAIAALAAGVALRAASVSAAADEERPSRRGDLTCGPRCVQFILQHYGHDEEDLIELVKELQWPDLERGATLASLQAGLERRGLFCRALQIHPDAELHWDYPVLVHTTLPTGEGHYVVWMPGSGDAGEYWWNGLEGQSRRLSVALSRTGVVLLTSPAAIADKDIDTVAEPPRGRFLLFALVSFFGAVSVSFLLLTRFRRTP